MPIVNSDTLTQSNAHKLISNLAKEYRASWKFKLCESTNIEEYGFNEYLGGKAEGFEEALAILEKTNIFLGEKRKQP